MALAQFFDHANREASIYGKWERGRVFEARMDPNRKPFVISMPPPNATGQLHLGHSVMLAIQDALIRQSRMTGHRALWLPGTDHAAIATESVVLKKLEQEGIQDPRTTLGREAVVARIAAYVRESQDTIRNQIRSMGSSCDWSRERYTMDPALNRCVNSVFSRMFQDGLIYRGLRIVNWDPVLQTTVSDDEIYHEPRQAQFYNIRYGPFIVGTSRPETKLGDTAVAVHPEDQRWNKYVGQVFEVNWPKGPTTQVRVVADHRIDPEMGTGAVGVTPAHSHIDFEIAQDHNLPIVQVIDENGKMMKAAGPYASLGVLECRNQFVKDLNESGLLVSVESYQQPISLCYRSKQSIEPLPKQQWFIDVNKPAVFWKGKLLSLKQTMKTVVEEGDIQILPEHEKRKYFHWIDKLRDWCISRQIWWGHRVPVWYRGKEQMYVGHHLPGPGWEQDPDTLDTWFSSALWTFSTLLDPKLAEEMAVDLDQWLQASPDIEFFHPTTVMETGYDILFFWVARMILMTTYVTGDIPFRHVYLHGLVLDKNGKKMSKSHPETCIDPLEVIKQQGADTLRLALILGNAPGQDMKLGTEKIIACRRFVNKVWNAGKLVLQKTGSLNEPHPGEPLHPVNRWMRQRFQWVADQSSDQFGRFALHEAAETIRMSFWADFCDFFLEASKDRSMHTPETASVMKRVFEGYLTLLHPFVPFVTEELWSHLGKDQLLATQSWPKDLIPDQASRVAVVDTVKELVTVVRRMRVELQITPGTQVTAQVLAVGNDEEMQQCQGIIEKLTRCRIVWLNQMPIQHERDTTVETTPGFTVAIHMPKQLRESERIILVKQLDKTSQRMEHLANRLADPAFTDRAKAEVVAKTRREFEENHLKVSSLKTKLAQFDSISPAN